jgi:hypothetical protein
VETIQESTDPLMDKGIKKNMEYFSALKREEIDIYVLMWISDMLSEVSHKRTNTL